MLTYTETLVGLLLVISLSFFMFFTRIPPAVEPFTICPLCEQIVR